MRFRIDATHRAGHPRGGVRLGVSLLATIAVVATCGSAGGSTTGSAYGSARSDTPTRPPVPATSSDASSSAPTEPRGSLGLADVLALVVEANPELAAAAWRIHATDGRVLQAGLRPNPTLGVEMEDFAGSGPYSGVRDAQTTLLLSQLVELGGKRAARIREAQRSQDLAAWDYEATRLDVMVAAVRAFTEVLGLQQEIALAQDDVDLAGKVVESAGSRVRAGSSSPAEEIRARMALASSQIALTRSRRDLEVARNRLAAMWGSKQAFFADVRGDLETIGPVPDAAALRSRLAANPDVARWAAEVEQRRAAFERERTQAAPDLSAGVGYRRLSGTDDNAVVLELSIPLPILNRNQGAILEAQRSISEAAEQQRAAEIRVSTSLTESFEAVASAHEQVTALRQRVLPGAKEAFAIVNEGYREGRFSYLDVLDAQRTWIEARTLHVRTLVDYHTAVAELERLVGAFEESPSAPRDGGGK